MAVVIAASCVGAIVLGARHFFGSTSGHSPGSAGSVSAPVPDPSTGPSSVSTVAVPAHRTPTAADPARVLLIGDSDAGGLSPFLDRVLTPIGLTATTTDYKVSSGFVRPDFFDWPQHFRDTVPAANSDIVVAVFGANDGQPFSDMATKPVDSPEWRAEYARRVGGAVDLLMSGGRTLIWVGVTNARDPSLTAKLQVQNEVVKQVIAQHPGVIYVDAWSAFAGIDGGFAPLAFDPRNASFVAVRQDSDGFHLNTTGEEILATYVGNEITADLRRRGATGAELDASTANTVDPTSPGTYTVVAGDSLTKIATATGTTVAAIVTANNWADASHVIFPDSKIQLPHKPVRS